MSLRMFPPAETIEEQSRFSPVPWPHLEAPPRPSSISAGEGLLLLIVQPQQHPNDEQADQPDLQRNRCTHSSSSFGEHRQI